jgi:hypothetical protein
MQYQSRHCNTNNLGKELLDSWQKIKRPTALKGLQEDNEA